MSDIENDLELLSDYDIINQARAKLEVSDIRYLGWFSFPWLFGSSIGPKEGIGKQVMTEFQVFGFINKQTHKCIKYCNGVWKESDSLTYNW